MSELLFITQLGKKESLHGCPHHEISDPISEESEFKNTLNYKVSLGLIATVPWSSTQCDAVFIKHGDSAFSPYRWE